MRFSLSSILYETVESNTLNSMATIIPHNVDVKAEKKFDVSVVPIVLTIGIKAHTVPSIPNKGNIVVKFEYNAYVLFIFSLKIINSFADNIFSVLVFFFSFSIASFGSFDNLSDGLNFSIQKRINYSHNNNYPIKLKKIIL